MSVKVVAIVGPGEDASDAALEDAAAVARGIATRGWTALTGGRAAGVMGAAARAASDAGGVVVGLLPGTTRDDAAPELTIALPTGLGEARNAVIATAADAIVVCGMNPGTASEAALAIRARKPIVFVRADDATTAFFRAFAAAATGGATIEFASDARLALQWLETHA